MKKIIAAIMTAALLGGCVANVEPEQIQEAYRLCAEHGGVDYLLAYQNASKVDVICNDGTNAIRWLGDSR